VKRSGPPLRRFAPQVAYQELPTYYQSPDIPHVLALIRTFDRFFAEVVERRCPHLYTDLHIAFIEMLEKQLQPYAFDLAVSLLSLEDELRDNRRVRPRKR